MSGNQVSGTGDQGARNQERETGNGNKKPDPRNAIPVVERTTHRHLLTVLHSELCRRVPDGATVRVLDAGCGNGHLMADLHRGLSLLTPPHRAELFGFDVHDWEYEDPGVLDRTAAYLTDAAPDIPWRDRLASLSTRDPWPYPDGFFDAIVSNQVVEHVEDFDLFLREIARTLAPGGFSVHLFPSQHTLIETHTGLPLVHWERNAEAQQRRVAFWSRLGIGQFRADHARTGKSLEQFVRENGDFLQRFVHYRTTRQLVEAAARHNLAADFRYTEGFYTAHLRTLLRLPPRTRYPHPARENRPFVWLLRYLSGITLFLEKDVR